MWTVTGLAAGWGARTLLGARRDFGLAGDLVTGWLGGLLGGWLFRRTGLVGPDDAATHVLVAAVGAAALLATLRTIRRLLAAANAATSMAARPSTADLEERIRRVQLRLRWSPLASPS